MGIASSVAFGDNCNFCFAPGETPLQIILAFSEIKQGDNWFPGNPAPPNNVYTLTQNIAVPCRYEDADAFHTTSLIFTVDQSFFVFNFSNPFRQVFSKIEGACKMFAENSFDIPEFRFYFGGKVQAWIV